jgi:hypothetical protein
MKAAAELRGSIFFLCHFKRADHCIAKATRGRGSATTVFTEVSSVMLRPKTSHSRSSRASADIPRCRRARDRNPPFSQRLCIFLPTCLASAGVAQLWGAKFRSASCVCGAGMGASRLPSRLRQISVTGAAMESGSVRCSGSLRLSLITSTLQDQPNPTSFSRRDRKPDRAGLSAPPT